MKTNQARRDELRRSYAAMHHVPAHLYDMLDDLDDADKAMARVEKERDVARLTVAQWDRMHAVCKETLEGRPDEFLPMVCSRVKGERDVAVAKLVAVAEVLNKGGMEHANSCFGPDGCGCSIGEIRNILNNAAMN